MFTWKYVYNCKYNKYSPVVKSFAYAYRWLIVIITYMGLPQLLMARNVIEILNLELNKWLLKSDHAINIWISTIHSFWQDSELEADQVEGYLQHAEGPPRGSLSVDWWDSGSRRATSPVPPCLLPICPTACRHNLTYCTNPAYPEVYKSRYMVTSTFKSSANLSYSCLVTIHHTEEG